MAFTGRIGQNNSYLANIELGVLGNLGITPLYGVPVKVQSRPFTLIVGLRVYTFKVQNRVYTFQVVPKTTMSQVQTQPSSMDVSTYKENFGVNIDFTNYLNVGETVSSATAKLVVTSTGYDQTATGLGTPAVTGNIVQTTLKANKLQNGQTYTMYVDILTSSARNLDAVLTVNAVA